MNNDSIKCITLLLYFITQEDADFDDDVTDVELDAEDSLHETQDVDDGNNLMVSLSLSLIPGAERLIC